MLVETRPAQPVQRAILCVDAETARNTAGLKIFGQPVLLHQITILHRLGIDEIAVAVETVPAAFPALVERLRNDGVRVSLLRSGAEAAMFAEQPGLILLQDGAVWPDRDILSDILQAGEPIVAVFPEDPERAAFERIDLNRRWAGLALLEGRLLQKSGDLPEGWRLASFLMRSALQAGYRDERIGVRSSSDCGIVHLSTASAPELEAMIRPTSSGEGLAERMLGRLADRALSSFGGHGWYRPLTQWSAPAFAALAAIAGVIRFDTTAYVLMFIALVGIYWGRHLRLLDYPATDNPWRDRISIALLLLTLPILLSAQTAVGDAIFLTFVAGGLMGLNQQGLRSRLSIELSPLILVAVLVLGHFVGAELWALKAAIAAMLAALLLSRRLNPN